jgi:hypothetical protein
MTKEEASEFHASSTGHVLSVQFLPGASVYKASLHTAAPQWEAHVIAVLLIALVGFHFTN